MRLVYESEEACDLNRKIFETIYYGALESSCELAERDGAYSTYPGSPVSQGILQFDMWNVTPSNMWNWDELKEKIAKYVQFLCITIIFPTKICLLCFVFLYSIITFFTF